MSIENSEVVDAVTVRDGFSVLTIFQLEPWPDSDRAAQLVEAKVRRYHDQVRSAPHLSVHSTRPHILELVCVDSPPPAVTALCRRLGVVVRSGET